MQDVAERIDQSCRRCASGQRCVYAKWSAAYIWLEVETRLRELGKSTDEVWNCNEQRRILNLMWHYACAVPGRAAKCAN